MLETTARELLLLVLLVKILAAASIASILARSGRFKRLLFKPAKSIHEQFIFGLWLGIPLMTGAALRVMLKYQAPELSLEGAALAGVLCGPIAGIVAGSLGSLPAILHHELLSLPVMVAAGSLGGFARQLAPD